MPEPLILVAHLPSDQQQALAEQVRMLDWPDGTTFKSPDRYHVTLLYSKTGDERSRAWLESCAGERTFDAVTGELDIFTNPGQWTAAPVVLRLDAPELTAFAERLIAEAPPRGLDPSRFDGGFKAHITVAFAPGLPGGQLPRTPVTLGPVGLWD